MKNHVFLLGFLALFVTSCVMRSPKYSTLAQAITLNIGMTKTEVETILGLEPYDLKARNDTAVVFIYMYRVTDRRTLSFNTTPVNGKEVLGKYIQLAVTYSNDDRVLSLESCNACADNVVSTRKVNIEKVILFITVTLPAILIYVGVKN